MLLFRYTLSCLLCALCAIQVYSQQGQAQSSRLDSLVAANSRVLQMKNGMLQGPGAEFLLAEAAQAQFVALGEEHNTTEIPELTTVLFRALEDRYRFRFLAIEQDPITMRWTAEPPVRGRRDQVVAIAQRYPYAFTFVSDQELTMLAQIGATSRTSARPIWGCDQAFGGTHILDRLRAITFSPAAREFIRTLRDAAWEKERKRDLDKHHYMGKEPKTDLLAKLREVVRPKSGSEAEMLVLSLIISDRIYSNHREGNYYENAYEREQYMKRRFLDEYRQAHTIERRPPKVLLKFGLWHLYRGFTPNHQQSLGNFVSELATANNSGSFHLAIFPNNAPGGYGDLGKWSDQAPKLLGRSLKATEWTLVDLRPLRAEYGRLAKEVSPDFKDGFRRLIFGYDAALFIGGMHSGTYHSNPGVEY